MKWCVVRQYAVAIPLALAFAFVLGGCSGSSNGSGSSDVATPPPTTDPPTGQDPARSAQWIDKLYENEPEKKPVAVAVAVATLALLNSTLGTETERYVEWIRKTHCAKAQMADGAMADFVALDAMALATDTPQQREQLRGIPPASE